MTNETRYLWGNEDITGLANQVKEMIVKEMVLENLLTEEKATDFIATTSIIAVKKGILGTWIDKIRGLDVNTNLVIVKLRKVTASSE